jgi:hypothetical protein
MGAAVLADFYGKCEAGGFEEVKLTYDYDYVDHVTGEVAHMSHVEPPADASLQHAFDGLVVCTGTNTWASLPKFKGQEEFQGKVIHSENYKKPDVFAGQRVMIIGAGESGSDICNEVAQVASKVAIVVRGKHGHLIPRKQADGRVTDLNTNRVRYSNPYLLGDWVGFANQHAKKFVAKWGGGKDPEEAQILQTIGKLNLQQGTSAFSKFGCKNEGFVTAMVTKGTELHRDGFKLNKVWWGSEQFLTRRSKEESESGSEFEKLTKEIRVCLYFFLTLCSLPSHPSSSPPTLCLLLLLPP